MQRKGSESRAKTFEFAKIKSKLTGSTSLGYNLVDLSSDNTVLDHPNTGLDARSIGLYLQNIRQTVFALFCALEPMPVLELAPELDPVLELVVASSPELKPVPVLELELGFE